MTVIDIKKLNPPFKGRSINGHFHIKMGDFLMFANRKLGPMKV
jgi:hypothetical protein